MPARLTNRHEGHTSCSHVRVLIVGDSGVGKTTLVQLIVNGRINESPCKTVGCAVDVKHVVCTDPSNHAETSVENGQDLFVELWEVSGHERYKSCRALFYSQISGVIFVYDLSQEKTKTSLKKWASEVASLGNFAATLQPQHSSLLPVPFLVIGNKADLTLTSKIKKRSPSIVNLARQWVSKQGFLSTNFELPMTESFPGNGGLFAAAQKEHLDLEAVDNFFISLFKEKEYSAVALASSLKTIQSKSD